MSFGIAVVMVRVNFLNQFNMKLGKTLYRCHEGTSRVRLMAELGWEEMKLRRAIHELICYFKIARKKEV